MSLESLLSPEKGLQIVMYILISISPVLTLSMNKRWLPFFFFFFFLLVAFLGIEEKYYYFYRSIVELQYLVSFRCTAQ